MHSAGRSTRMTRKMVHISITRHGKQCAYCSVTEGATGKDVLQELVKDHRAEYQDLTLDEKAELLLEYGEHKETQATGIRISTKSKVNDVTQTLKAVENEVSPPWIFYFCPLM
jgi:hypothetical protein